MNTLTNTRLHWLPVLLLVPILVFATACDSGGSNGGNGNGDGPTQADFENRVDLIESNNKFTAPNLQGIDRGRNGNLNPTPSSNPLSPRAKADFENTSGTVRDNYTGMGVDLSDITDKNYVGAFDPNAGSRWTKDWTKLSSHGYTSGSGSNNTTTSGNTQKVVTDDITGDVTWTSSETIILDGLIFVEAGGTLTIEPGTVIKGRNDSDNNPEISTDEGASALIVKQGGEINASGTASDPIIFTAEKDDLGNLSDLGPTDRGLWGGLIVLGNAPISEGTQVQIEGIPASEDAEFGGTSPDESSGTLEYISIRHGGFSISGVSGDEINGLTLGGIGSGTTINHIEVFANLDDGIEWFGGKPHADHLVAAFCGDDAFDWDTGYRGTGQYWFAIQGPDDGNRAGELDGFDSTTDENAEEFSDPVISNATFIGTGKSSGVSSNGTTLRIRNGGASEWYNSIFTDFPSTAVKVDLDDGANERLKEGDIVLNNNVFFDYGAGNTLAAIMEDTES